MAGVGGRTIAEAKENVSISEYFDWMNYRKKRGPLNPFLRNEAAIARLCVMLNRIHGGKAEMIDFMPWSKDEDEIDLETDGMPTPEQVMGLLKPLGVAKPKPSQATTKTIKKSK